jgi:hypothetical protein
LLRNIMFDPVYALLFFIPFLTMSWSVQLDKFKGMVATMIAGMVEYITFQETQRSEKAAACAATAAGQSKQ